MAEYPYIDAQIIDTDLFSGSADTFRTAYGGFYEEVEGETDAISGEASTEIEQIGQGDSAGGFAYDLVGYFDADNTETIDESVLIANRKIPMRVYSDSELISNVEVTISGGYDGYIYKQDSGNVWTRSGGTTNIDATYRSPDITMGDPGIRKTMQRVNLNWKPEGAVSANMYVKYNYDDVSTPQPNVFTLSTSGSGAAYGVGLFGTAAFGQGDLPITRQTVEGSGFAVAIKITDTSSNIPFSIKGFQLEFTPGGRA